MYPYSFKQCLLELFLTRDLAQSLLLCDLRQVTSPLCAWGPSSLWGEWTDLTSSLKVHGGALDVCKPLYGSGSTGCIPERSWVAERPTAERRPHSCAVLLLTSFEFWTKGMHYLFKNKHIIFVLKRKESVCKSMCVGVYQSLLGKDP